MIYYRVRAYETDTLNDTVFEGSTPSFDVALDHAERRAAAYYGGDDATWFTTDGLGRDLVGRISQHGSRKPVTCVTTVEEEEIDEEEDLEPW